MTSQEQFPINQPPATAEVNPLLPAEFQYAGQQPQLAQNDLSRFYIPREPVGQIPAAGIPSALPPTDGQVQPPQSAQLPVGPPDYLGPSDKQWPLNQQRMTNDEGSYGPTWLFDRGAGLAGSAIAAARFDPALAAKLPLGHEWPTVTSMQSIGRDEWQRFLPSQYGKLLGGAFVADTLIDQMFLSDRTSSPATMAVDFGVPMAAKWLLSRYSLPISLGLSIGAHVAEKYFLEDKR